MMLEFAVAAESEPAHDAHHCGGVGLQPFGHGANTKQHVFARVLENRANDFLALGAELFDALRQIGRLRRRCGGEFLHGARESPKSVLMSTYARMNRITRLPRTAAYL